MIKAIHGIFLSTLFFGFPAALISSVLGFEIATWRWAAMITGVLLLDKFTTSLIRATSP